jgi:hypothetical protein
VKRRTRLLVVLLGAGLTALAGCTGSASAWRTYRQPAGPMHLSYRYPASWQVAGDALVSTMGWVGRAELTTGTSGSLHDLITAGCDRRGTALGDSGIFVTWTANLGAPSPIKLTQYRGQALLVNGHPARWFEQSSTICFKGRIVGGVIQEGPRKFLFMGADVGSAVPDAKIKTLRTIFESARW